MTERRQERTSSEGCGGVREITLVRSVMSQPGGVFLPGSDRSPGPKNFSPRMTAQTKFFITLVFSKSHWENQRWYLTQGYYRYLHPHPNFFGKDPCALLGNAFHQLWTIFVAMSKERLFLKSVFQIGIRVLLFLNKSASSRDYLSTRNFRFTK